MLKGLLYVALIADMQFSAAAADVWAQSTKPVGVKGSEKARDHSCLHRFRINLLCPVCQCPPAQWWYTICVVLVLLPGMDGTGRLFSPFLSQLPQGVRVRVVRYPGDIHLNYWQLAGLVRQELPIGEPYVIVAESYSGPVAITVAEQPVGDLRGVVLVSSFISQPLGSSGVWIARFPLAMIFRIRPPGWVLRRLLMNDWDSAEMVSAVRDAIECVRPEVLAARVRDALKVDCSDALRRCGVRLVCLVAARDRLLKREPFDRAPQKVEVVTIPAPHLLLQCAPKEAVDVLTRLGLMVDK
jgi:hypothetical protein